MTRERSDSSTTSDAERQALDELAEQFFEERRAGAAVTVEDYAARHPELADEIRRVLPALIGLERAVPQGSPSASPAPPVERLGEYTIVREIGRGGMGVVYEATQETLGRHVALKVLPPQAVLDPRYLERFRREAQAAASLQHPNIVPVIGVGEEEGVHFFAMQYVEGKPLDRVLGEIRNWRRGGGARAERTTSSAASTLTSGEGSDERYFHSVGRIGLQLAEALAHAHARGVVHRDVKPSNVLLDGGGTPWISDFGLAKTDESGDLTASGDVVGTLRYLAPECLSGTSDARVDVYGLGMVLYELLTLKPAFDESDRGQLIRKVARDLPVRPRRVDRRIPQDLESIVLKAIENSRSCATGARKSWRWISAPFSSGARCPRGRRA